MSDDIRIRLALDGAQDVQAGADRAAAAVGRFGTQAAAAGRQTQLSGQQMAQVSAQLQDLFVQIQAGGNPMTALLQQGSQLSGVFGGVGNALRAVGSLITPTVAALGGLAATVGAAAAAYAQGSAEADAYRQAIVLTGNAAGVTVGQLQDMARAQAALAGTQGRAAEVLAQMAASGNVAGAQLAAAADAAIRLERAGGPAAEETAKKFAELGKSPVEALRKLNEAENFLTEGVYKQVKALQEQGRTAEAASVAQTAYAAAVAQRAETLASNLGTLERGWLGVKDLAKQAWDAMLNVGRPDTLGERLEDSAKKLAALQKQLEEVESGQARGTPGYTRDSYAARIREKIEAERQNQAALQETQRMNQRVSTAEQERAAAVKATIKAEQEAAKARAAALSQGERDIALQERAIGLTGTYAKDLQALQSARARGVLTEEQYLDAVQKVVAAQPVIVAGAKAQAEAEAAKARALAEGVRAYEQQVEAQRRSAQSVVDQVQKLRDEEAAAQLAADKNISLAEAIQQVAIARLQEAQARSQDIGEVDRLQREIDARRELATLIDSREARTAASRSAQDAAREWERASQDIERSLTDALLRGFESGKGFAKNLRDTLANLFQTLVLRPIIQPLVGSLAGGLGLVGSASAAGQGASALSGLGGLGNLASIGSLISSGLTGSLANIIGGAGSLFGSSALTAFATGLQGSTLATGLAGPTTAGATGALGAGASLGGFISAALPFVGGAALIGNALGLFRSNRQVGAGITGQLGGTIEDFVVNRRGGSLFSGPSYSTPTTGVSNFNADLQATFNALRQNAASMAEALGLSGNAARNFVTAIGSEKLSDDTGGQGIRLEGLTAEQVTAKLQEELTKANERLAEAVLGSASAAFARTGETASQTLERLAGSLTGVNGVLGVLGQSLLAVSAAGGDTASKLLQGFGGLQQFQAAAGQYLQDFYSEAERTALGTQQLTQQLGAFGLALPTTRDAYRQLVEAQDLSTESGRAAYTALLQLAPQFAQLVPAIEGVGSAVDQTAAQAAEAAARMAEAGRRVLEDLARSRGDLEVELLRAQGNTTAANARQRGLDLADLTTGLSSTDAAAATAAYDYNAALRAQIEALNAATQAAEQAAQAEAQRQQAIEAQRAGLQQQIDQLTGNTEALRARELASLDASNRALQERIYALQDAAKAEAEAAQAAQQAAQQAQAIANQRAGLEQRILQLQGNTTALRALELAGLDASNRALQEQIYALQDAAEAEARAAQVAAEAARVAQEAAQRQEAIASAAISREARIAQLLGLTSEVRRIELESLDAYNRGLQETIYELEDAAAAAQQAAAVASQRAGLERQLLQLQGNTSALRALELAALDPANRALQERIYALQDSAEAEAAAARAAEEAAQRAQAIANERAGLDRQLLQLQGNTTALRALELAGLDASNRALQEQIYALQDQQTAAEQAAQALQAFQDKLTGLGDTRFDLEQQLLQAQGNNPEAARLLRERDLARLTAGLTADQAAQVVAAYDYNEALRQQIRATTEAQQAAEALAAEQARAAEAAQQAAEQFRSAWQSVADTLFDEVARIRGLLTGGPGGLTLAQAQAQFAIATGQARAGDQDAARQLPALSQALLELATANAGSLLELNRIRAAIAASLQETGTGLAGRFGLSVPKLSTGTNLVPRDMLALLHEGEAVVPRAFNPAAGGAAGSPEVVQEIRLLLDAIQAGDLATVRQLGELLRIVKTWDGNGLPETRVTT